MSLCCCNVRCKCTLAALLASGLIGILTAFFQITGVFTLTTVFLWVALGIATVALGILLLASGQCCGRNGCDCRCSTLRTLLAGILGTVLFSLILLAIGITATSILSAVLAGLLLFFLALTFTAAACYVQYSAGCDD